MATISVCCPACRSTLRAPEEYVGRKASCAQCGERFIVEPAAALVGTVSPETSRMSSAHQASLANGCDLPEPALFVPAPPGPKEVGLSQTVVPRGGFPRDRKVRSLLTVGSVFGVVILAWIMGGHLNSKEPVAAALASSPPSNRTEIHLPPSSPVSLPPEIEAALRRVERQQHIILEKAKENNVLLHALADRLGRLEKISQQPQPTEHLPPTQTPRPVEPPTLTFVQSPGPAQLGPVSVRIKWIRVGSIKIAGNAIYGSTTSDRVLSIELEIKNESRSQVPYESWSGEIISIDGGNAAHLVDSQGKNYRRKYSPTSEFGPAPEGRTRSATIDRGNGITDVLAFEPPVTDDAEFLDLVLPGRNVRASGEIRIRIPYTNLAN